MKKICKQLVFLWIHFLMSGTALFAQQQVPFSSLLRYSDFHIHPTYKHYFRDFTIEDMRKILATVRYNPGTDEIEIPDSIRKKYSKMNWEKYEIVSNKQYNQLTRAEVSDLLNYDQASYSEIAHVPGSILCNSYSPYEKQFALSYINRLISSKVVTKVDTSRLNAYALKSHSPFRDFLAEYYFNAIQEEKRLVVMEPLKALYDDNLSGKDVVRPPIVFYDSIRMVKNGEELSRILAHNDRVFQSNLDYTGGVPPTVITPLIMCVEGGQVFYDTISGDENVIVDPQFLNKSLRTKNGILNKKGIDQYRQVKAEMLEAVSAIRNLKHRMFFVNVAHFAQNHTASFSKTLDREPEHFAHRLLSTITAFEFLKKKILKKDFEGINIVMNQIHSDKPYDSLGFIVIDSLLDPARSKFLKPTYIDIKHMDVLGRIQYYQKRRSYMQKYGLKSLPIIASHMAVSGESQVLAAATGLNLLKRHRQTKMSDRYWEVINPLYIYKLYQRKFEKGKWKQRIFSYTGQNSYKKPDMLSVQANQEYVNQILRLSKEDPDISGIRQISGSNVKKYINARKIDLLYDEKKAGWYYPWSINLFDEEIIEIYQSGGIIGLMMDPRQLGAYMRKYQKIESLKLSDSPKSLSERFNELVSRDPLLANAGIEAGVVNRTEYFKTEPLLRNIFYIIQLVKQYNAADADYHLHNNLQLARKKCNIYFPHADVDCTTYDPWDLLSIGADFDGLIDPMDISPTASYIPYMRSRLEVYAYIYAQLHWSEFKDPVTGAPLITSVTESKRLMEKIFYSNGRRFITTYF